MLVHDNFFRDDLGFGSERTVAVFDFDNTLVKGDSLWPFLIAVAGRFRCYLALLEAVLDLAFVKTDDPRTFIKEHLLRRLLARRKLADVQSVLKNFAKWPEWLEPTTSTLRMHHAAGHHVVIASGGLDLYLPTLLEDIPYHALICTGMEVKDGVITGAMQTQNCVRTRKAQMVETYLKTQDPFPVSWGYGNYPHDVPMLDLLQHRVVV